MTKMTAKAKPDQAVKPGSLISATIRLVANGCIVEWSHTPDKAPGGGLSYVDHAPNVYGSIEEACHAIAQAFGGNSELATEEADEAAA